MKRIYIFRGYIFLLCLFFNALSIGETGDIFICCDSSMSDIAAIITEIKALDCDLSSPLHLFKSYCVEDCLFALRSEAIDVLGYAGWFISNYNDEEVRSLLSLRLNRVIDQVLNNELDVSKENIMRSDMLLNVYSKARFKHDVRMDKKLNVYGKAYCDDGAEFKDDVTIKKDLIVDGGILVEGDLSAQDIVLVNLTTETLSVTNQLIAPNHSLFDQMVGGTLSASEILVNCDFTVTCNVNMNISENDQIGNITKTLSGDKFIHNNGINNTFVGVKAGNSGNNGPNNTGLGFIALQTNTNGTDNTAVGASAVSANTLGNRNTAIGSVALAHNITGIDNTAVGFQALMDSAVGVENIAIGSSVLEANTTGIKNVAIGSNAFKVGIDSSNTAIGYQALLRNTTGHENTAAGAMALIDNVTGSFNTALGNRAGIGNTKGDSNTIIGSSAGFFQYQGSDNIFINAIPNAVLINSSTYIGNPLGGYNKTLVAGIFSIPVNAGAPVVINQSGQLGAIPSSKRFKSDIQNITQESALSYGLRPVKFTYDDDDIEIKQYGLIAEEVARIFPELVVNDKEDLPITVRYELLPVLLLHAMQKQQQRIKSLQRTFQESKDLFNALTLQVNDFIAQN